MFDLDGVIDFQRNTATDEGQNLFKAGAIAGSQLRSIDPSDDKVRDVGIGVTYIRGEDPDEGFGHQANWQLSIKFRLK